MAVAGYCRVCGQYVYLDEQWGCAHGHAYTEISNWYDPEKGVAVTPYWLQQPGHAHPATSDRLGLLAALLDTLTANPAYMAQYGTDTDIVIANTVADASWTGGRKKIEYSAVLKAVEEEHTIYFWELLKESGGGLSFGTISSESYSTVGTKRFGTGREKVVGPGGVGMDAAWDYAATRELVESTAAAHGWRVKTVLRKSAASW